MWTLKSLTVSDSDQRTIVRTWFDEQDDAVQNRFLVEMKFLVGLAGGRWIRPYVGQLHGKCEGLIEVVLTVNDTQHRPIGYFSGKQEFTFLFFAIEKHNEFDPANTCELAQAAKRIAESIKERVRAITI